MSSQPDAELMNMFDFTADDLEANRQGKIKQHTMDISHVDFEIKPSTYRLLGEYIQRIGIHKTYKVYYTEKTLTVLSVERLS